MTIPDQPTLLTTDRAALLGIVEQLLRDNAGNRITGSLILGIVTAAERTVPAREPEQIAPDPNLNVMPCWGGVSQINVAPPAPLVQAFNAPAPAPASEPAA